MGRSDPQRNAKGRLPRRIREDPKEQGLVTLRFLGAARTTTGSLHRVRTPDGDVLLECGMYQGHRAEAESWNRDLPVDPERVKAVILSHGHIDHCGALPNLVKRGYRGPVWCTEATADLLPVMLLDAAHIQESDAARINRHVKGDKPRKQPLYTVKDAERSLRLVRGVPYGKPFEALKGVEARFVDAGHIIGSAAVHLTLRADGRTTTLGFTGDLGRRDVPILRDPEPLGAVDWYITESTYGNRDHEDTGDLMGKLEDAVVTAAGRGGKVIIPAFAVGRTQLILFLLHKLRAEGRIPDVPIYVDSPMATRATEVFKQNRDLYDTEAMEFLTCNGPLFRSARTSFVADVDESKALNHLDGPAVIISASGMCEGGRILHHLRNHATDRRNLVLFVGYQAEHTLGRRILEGERVKIYGDRVDLAAEVRRINGLSAHADRGGLLRYAQALDGVPKGIFLVHGDDDRIAALQSWFHQHGLPGAKGPHPGDWTRLL
jgi:metallo-beta-lactamase family protein